LFVWRLNEKNYSMIVTKLTIIYQLTKYKMLLMNILVSKRNYTKQTFSQSHLI
jgi:hypothetical protein